MQLGNPVGLRLLNDNGLREALEAQRIRVTPHPTDDQIQPATLDVRIGRVHVYDREAFRRGAEAWNAAASIDAEPTDEFAKKHADEKDTPITIPSGAYAEIYLHETIDYRVSEYYARIDLRSSRGRLHLALSTQLEKHDGKQYVGVWNNNPNDIILYGRSKFAQLFFHPASTVPSNGHIVTDPEEAADLFPSFASQNLITPEGYLVFLTGDTMRCFKRVGTIDTKRSYTDDELYDTITIGEHTAIGIGDAPIVNLFPAVRIPANVGVHLLHKHPYAQTSGLFRPDTTLLGIDAHQLNAGWVDPGYEGIVTAHPHRYKFPQRVFPRMPFALGTVYRYENDAQRAYGTSALGNHYQGSSGAGSRS